MNRALIHQYLAQYKAKFNEINDEEIYKWQAVQHFQATWDQDAENFTSMLTDALSKTSNLLDSGLYFPRRMIIESAEVSPESVRTAFANLYDESTALQVRVDAFQERLEQIVHTTWPWKKHYQDHRAILVYLSLRYPDTHYLYKYGVLETFCERTGYDYKPVSGRFSNIETFYEICETVKKQILTDPELRELHFARLSENDYPDTNFNILTQDFLFAIQYYLTLDDESIAENQVTLIPSPAQAILNVLVNHIQQGKVIPSDPQTFIGYKQVHDLLDLPMMAIAYGKSLQRQGLEALTQWTIEKNFPAITGLVIDWSTSMPGPGYFKLYGKSTEDFSWWKNEIIKSIEFDWSPFIEDEQSHSMQQRDVNGKESNEIGDGEDNIPASINYFETPKAIDFEEPELPDRAESTSYRIIRDTKKAVWVKDVYARHCQICGETIELRDRNYSEAHHIKPLGQPHNGPDHESNIISVCPNHHAMLDYFALQLDMAQLNLHPVHQLNPEYIHYHNSQFEKKRSSTSQRS